MEDSEKRAKIILLIIVIFAIFFLIGILIIREYAEKGTCDYGEKRFWKPIEYKGSLHLIDPPNKAINQPIPPKFEWSKCLGANYLIFQIDDEKNFTLPLIYESKPLNNNISTFTLPIYLEMNKTYFWRVIAHGSYREDQALNAPFSFTTIKPKVPDIILENESLPFAVIGDYLGTLPQSREVANLVNGFDPEFILTVGDNINDDKQNRLIDQSVGQLYSNYIFPYTGNYTSNATENRFWPSIGNHDYLEGDNYTIYTNYFNLPGNERYYDFIKNNIHFFALNSDVHEPSGTNITSIQAEWLKNRLNSSISKWNIVYFHHSPYSSGLSHNDNRMQWPFEEWGADLVISGHEHQYERLVVKNITYIVDGLGGKSISGFKDKPLNTSIIRYNQSYGALLIIGSKNNLNISFYNTTGDLIDNSIIY